MNEVPTTEEGATRRPPPKESSFSYSFHGIIVVTRFHLSLYPLHSAPRQGGNDQAER